MTQIRSTFFILFLAALAGALVSCKTYFYTPVYVVTLHEFSEQEFSGNLVVRVKDGNNQNPRSIRRFPFLNSGNFYQGEIYGPEANGKYGVRLSVDPFGAHNLNTAATENLGQLFSIVVDGTFVGFSPFTDEMKNGSTVVLAPLWSQAEAQLIVDHIKPNFNKNTGWWNK